MTSRTNSWYALRKRPCRPSAAGAASASSPECATSTQAKPAPCRMAATMLRQVALVVHHQDALVAQMPVHHAEPARRHFATSLSSFRTALCHSFAPHSARRAQSVRRPQGGAGRGRVLALRKGSDGFSLVPAGPRRLAPNLPQAFVWREITEVGNLLRPMPPKHLVAQTEADRSASRWHEKAPGASDFGDFSPKRTHAPSDAAPADFRGAARSLSAPRFVRQSQGRRAKAVRCGF